MGMDVYGKNPKNKTGEYFRNNVWWWRPLWDYCLSVAPELCAGIMGHTNDGDGLNEEDSLLLAQKLQDRIDIGSTGEFQKGYEQHLENLPLEACEISKGKGMRKKPPDIGPGDMRCNGCDGKGMRKSYETHYPFSVENVQEFVEFLKACGGFEIL